MPLPLSFQVFAILMRVCENVSRPAPTTRFPEFPLWALWLLLFAFMIIKMLHMFAAPPGSRIRFVICGGGAFKLAKLFISEYLLFNLEQELSWAAKWKCPERLSESLS